MEPEIRKYPPTLHLSDSGLLSKHGEPGRLDWRNLVGRNVVLEEKVDGSQAGFWFDSGGELHILNRGNELDPGSRDTAEKPFNLLKDWLGMHADAFLDRFEDRYVVYGEWPLLAHTVFYDALPHYFLEFDILDRVSGEFLSTPRRRELLSGLPIVSVPVLHSGAAQLDAPPQSFVRPSLFKTPEWRHALKMAARKTGLDEMQAAASIEDSDMSEGIYGKVEEDGRVVLRFKWVRPAFIQHIVGAGRHWSSRPAISNTLADGIDIFAQPEDVVRDSAWPRP